MRTASTTIFLVVALVANGCSESTQEPEPPPSEIRVETVATGLSSPVFLTSPANDQRLFVVEQVGRIRIIQNGQLLETPFLDIRSRVLSGGERGLLSMVFHPNYATNGFFYVNFTDQPGGHTRVERFTVTAGSPNVANAASSKLIIAINQPFSNHNGGQLAFGADGKLYIGMGDGGSGGDPLNHGQDRSTLLGDLLRIDIDAGDPYAIPADNPYAGSTQFRPEIWAYGLRNPWRFSFDRTDGVIYIADVGQNQYEEINAVSATQAGVNYGWRTMEGAHCYNTTNCTTTGLQQPVHEYTHADGCSITGGYVYRGSRIPGLVGHYLYSDYCTGFLKSFKLVNRAATDHRTWNIGDIGSVLSFGQDASGELYILTSNGRVSRIIP